MTDSKPSAGDIPRLVVDLIIPIYNVEPYLRECLDSVVAQTIFEQIHVVLVNDGSTDNSGEIAEEYAKKYWNVDYVVTRNRGLGACRNTGLAHVTTDYVTFLDSDDILPDGALERLLTAMEAGADIAVGNMVSFPVQRTWAWQKDLEQPGSITSVGDRPDLIHNASACNKMFRAAYFADSRHHFKEGSHFEDAPIVVPALLEARSITIVEGPVYLYRKRVEAGSIMDNLFDRPANYWNHLEVSEQIAAVFVDAPLTTQRLALKFNVRALAGFVLNAPDVFDDDELAQFIARVRDLLAPWSDGDLARLIESTRLRRALYGVRTSEGRVELRSVAESNHLVVSGKGIFAGTPSLAGHGQPHEPSPSPLLQVAKVRVFLESVRLRDRHVLLSGWLSLPGIPATVPLPEEVSLRVMWQGGGRVVTFHHRLGRAGVHDWSHWSVSVPVSELPEGEHSLSARLRAPGGRRTFQLRSTRGFCRSARTLRVGAAAIRFRPDDHGRVVLEKSSGRRSRFVRRARGALADIVAPITGKPFGWARFLWVVGRPWQRRRPIVLYGERHDTAQDNGFAMFQYARTHDSTARHHYLIDKSAGMSLGMRQRRDGVVWRDGLRHRWLYANARTLVSSQDIDAYMLPERWDPTDYRRHFAWRAGARRIFLQHGIIINGVGPNLRSGITGLDRFVCTAEPELDYLRESTGYGAELVLTGLPRLDLLERTSPPERRILFMPTWRKYLVTPSYADTEEASHGSAFAGSVYEEFFAQVVGSSRLRVILERYDYHLDLLPHYEVAAEFASMAQGSTRIDVVRDGGASIRERLLRSSLCISDHSSVVYDAAYLGMPVIHAPFDEDEFYSRHYSRGWFDFERDGVGPVVRTPDALIDAIERYLASGCAREPLYDARSARMFAHHDGGNRARNLDEILAVTR